MAKIMKDGKPSTSMSRQDREWVKSMGGGGGGDITVEELSVTENGTYTAPEGKAYSPVTVNVSSLADDVFELQATVTFNVTSASEAVLTETYWDVAAIEAENISAPYQVITGEYSVVSGTHKILFFAASAEYGAGFEYDTSAWTITVTSGNATVNAEDSYVEIKGDCTLAVVAN